MAQEIKVPDIGDFKNVPVIEVFVKPGDVIKAEDPLIALESDKATMEVPSPLGGVVAEVKLKVGDKVGEGTLILTLEGGDAKPSAAPVAAPAPAPAGALHAEVLVLGAGPGGYSAAFRAADLGKKVVVIERWPVLGGVCLNVGCIPSKALLHAAKVIDEAADFSSHGISFGKPEIDIGKIRDWKDSVVKRLTGGLAGMAKQRKVTVVTGLGAFASPNTIEVTAADGARQTISFDKAIIAAGSEPVTLPFIPHADKRVIDSTGALELADVPKRLLVLGGGIIGLEMATVYHSLGTKVTVVELLDQIIPGADKDIVAPLAKRIEKRYERILLKTKVVAVKAEDAGLRVTFEAADGAKTEDLFDKLLVAVGRKPNGKLIHAEAAGVKVDERGFIAVDKQLRTNVAHIFAIGDIVGQPMLAHKAVHEGHVAAEVASGHKAAFDAKVIPSVAYTDPEVAWVGLTENEAKAKGVKYGKASFPWAASGRALALGRDEGVTKSIFDAETKRLIGCGMVGPGAGDLIAEAALAIEMGADAQDIALTIHPHPTLSETFGLAAELFEGTITDLIAPKKK
ncbi:dihydrolipoyl dehydrogenase [uncultured Rhodoblastus sp.]|uniref:dihydrolipoyl dehydrogenase n=1 Tax=uncultured Rhodoblastus sp. TaxID=543037 RepID=UPI0025D4998B|nr:dihydrolipoyl dehydrogenase [uncultured Rhodoblastus sp.]